MNERALALDQYQGQRFREHPESAKKLIAVGDAKPEESLDTVELAAWTTVMSIILNLDETVTKE